MEYDYLRKQVSRQGERFVRTARDNIVISEAERLAEKLNYEFGNKTKAKGA